MPKKHQTASQKLNLPLTGASHRIAFCKQKGQNRYQYVTRKSTTVFAKRGGRQDWYCLWETERKWLRVQKDALLDAKRASFCIQNATFGTPKGRVSHYKKPPFATLGTSYGCTKQYSITSTHWHGATYACTHLLAIFSGKISRKQNIASTEGRQKARRNHIARFGLHCDKQPTAHHAIRKTAGDQPG